jgi:ankyrin repeat protein
MGLDALPTELICHIARFLHSPRDVNALVRTNQRFYAILDPVLYKCTAKLLSGHVLHWAAKKDSIETAKKVLQCGAHPSTIEAGEQCALRLAVIHGRLPIVKLLLNYGTLIRDPMILGTAAFNGDDVITELLLSHGASPNVVCDGKTPLLIAAQQRNESTFTLLLQRGADPFARDSEQMSALFYAVDGGCTKILAKLLDLGLGIYKNIGGSRIALLHAARLGRLDAVKLFIERGVDVNFTDTFGRTALLWAATGGHLEVVQYLLKQGALLEPYDECGNTPALQAARKGRTSVVGVLLDHGVSIEHADENGQTLLSWAALEGHGDTTQLLLDRGANVETVDNRGRTPLLWAAEASCVETAKMLIDRGANVNSSDGESSPLSLAAHNGDSPMVRLLLRARASTEFTTPKKQTPLILAAMSEGASRFNAVRALLDNGANMEAIDEDGKTALYYTLRSSEDLFNLFAARGANLNARDNLGRNLLMYASMGGPGNHIETLIKMGLNVNDQDGDGMTALHHAVKHEATKSMLPLLRGGADPEIRNQEGLSVYELARLAGTDDLLMAAEGELESTRF